MNVTREEAAAALREVDDARRRMFRTGFYARCAPYLIIWGLVWLIANSAGDFDTRLMGPAWMVCSLVGMALTIVLSIRQQGKEGGRRGDIAWGLMWPVLGCYFWALFIITGPLDWRQANALISIFYPFAYMMVGAWIGWRLFFVGAVTAALILGGFVYVHEHFALYMGVVGGGALIAGGLWLRKV